MNAKIFSRINALIATMPTCIRMPIYRFLSKGNIDKDAYIGPNCVIDSMKNIKLNSGANINGFCRFLTSDGVSATVTIGNNSWIGCGVSFVCITHEMGDCSKRAGKTLFEPIVIGNGVWIGANVTILPGVKIADGCVIGAGSVVVKDTEINGLYAGNPAVFKKGLGE